MRANPAVLLAVALAAVTADADDTALNLPLGDPARRDREAVLLVDGITDTGKGDGLTPAALAARLDGVRVLFVGENHDSMESHRMQKRVIEELLRRGRRVLVGLELSRWYKNWATTGTTTALLSMDGVPIAEKETTNRLLAEKRWGDAAAEFKVRRGAEVVTLTAYFRRRGPETSQPASPPGGQVSPRRSRRARGRRLP